MSTRQSKLSASGLARQQVAPVCAPTPVCVLTRDMDDVHFNSTRVAGTDRLDSSDVELSFNVSEAFVADVSQWLAANGGESVDAAVAANVSCEVLFYDGGVPTVFVEEEVPGTREMRYRMSSIPPLKLRTSFCAAKRYLRVWVERKMPLSSSHGGRRFILAFLLGKEDVVCTRPFLVFAKKAKEGVGSKFKYQPTFVDVDPHRANVLSRFQTKLGSVDGRSSWAGDSAASLATPSVSAPSTGACAAPVKVLAHPLARAKQTAASLKRRAGSASASEGSPAATTAVAGEKRARVLASDAEGSPESVTALCVSTKDWLAENDLLDVYGTPLPAPSTLPSTSPALKPLQALPSPHCGLLDGLLDDDALSTPMFESMLASQLQNDVDDVATYDIDVATLDELFASRTESV